MKSLKYLSFICSMIILFTSLGTIGIASTETGKESVPFINSYSITSPLRNDFDNFIGMKITIGNEPLKITSLGRMFFAGNTQSHELKLVDAETKNDVPGTSISVQGGSVGEFTYAALNEPVTLLANHSYFLVSKENINGDNFAEGSTQVTTSKNASCSGWVFCIDGVYTDGNYVGSTFVLLNFKYEVDKVNVVNKTDLVTDVNLLHLRNDFGNWIGMKITVAEKDVAVTELGRIFISGNTQSHLVKIVDAQTKTDIPGAIAFVNGGVNGEFTYSKLTEPVILKANQSYYILSLEYYLGDQFGEGDTYISTTTDAACNGRVFCIDGVYTESLDNGYAYVPVSVKYGFIQEIQEPTPTEEIQGPTPTTEVQEPTPTEDAQEPTPAIEESTYIKEFNVGTKRNNFDSWVGMKITIGKDDINVTSLGRLFLNGNTQSHDLKIVDSKTGNDVSGSNVKVTGGTDNQFTYTGFSTPVTLYAGKSYYLMSREYIDGDFWCDADSSVITSAAALSNGWVYFVDSKYTEGNFPGYSFGLVNMKYEKKQNVVPKTINKLVKSYNFGTFRNDFNSWVGMRITVGANPLTVTSLGRMFIDGNKQSHKLKLVDATTGYDVPGSIVTVSGGTDKNITYKDLDETIILEANKSYYVMSLEYNNGDKWYDGDSTIMTTSGATCDGWTYFLPDTGYNFGNFPGHSFVILDLKYGIVSNNPVTGDAGNNNTILYMICIIVIGFVNILLFRRKINA